MESKKPKGKSFSGRSSVMRSSPWLAAEDIAGSGDVVVTIEDAILYDSVEFEKGRFKKPCYTLKFKGKDKELVLNETMRKFLDVTFGTTTDEGVVISNTKDWIGKDVALYITTTTLMGQRVPCIRIRSPKK